MSFGAFRLFTQDKPVVNTSQPAKQAPVLQPGTLAAITSAGPSVVPSTNSFLSRLKQEKVTTMGKPPKKGFLEEDFPALGGKKVVVPVVARAKYSDLAKDWAKKQEEEQENAKRMTEEEQKLKKMDYYDRVAIQVSAKLQKIHVKKAVDDQEDEVELPPQDDYDTYDVPVEEEEEEEEYDPTVDYRRNRNELSTF